MKDNFNSFQTYIGCFNIRILENSDIRFEVDRCQIQPALSVFTVSTVRTASVIGWYAEWQRANNIVFKIVTIFLFDYVIVHAKVVIGTYIINV